MSFLFSLLNGYSITYALLHLAVMVGAGVAYSRRRRRYLGILASLGQKIEPGTLDALNHAHGAMQAAKLLLIILLCWEFGGCALLVAAGHFEGLW